jgi:AcrR family transcriptional regulator
MSRVMASQHRRSLVAAAIRVMTREGVTAASTRRIAAEAGVAQATIHYVFGTKTELYRAVIEEATDNLVLAVEQGLAPQAQWHEQVSGAVGGAWSVIETNPDIALLLLELTVYALREPDLKDVAERLYESYQGLAERAGTALTERSQREQRLPVDEVARLAVAALNGLAISHLVHGDRERSRRDLDNLVDALTAVAVGPRVVA